MKRIGPLGGGSNLFSGEGCFFDTKGITVLMLFSYCGYLERVKYLVEYGEGVNLVNKDRISVLYVIKKKR